MGNMCTKEDVKMKVIEAFNEDGGLRDEIQSDIKKELKLAALQILTIYGITLITSAIAFTIFITGIRSDVDGLREFASSGDRFTQSDAALLEQRIESNTQTLKDVARKEDMQRMEETLIRLDERIRNSGI